MYVPENVLSWGDCNVTFLHPAPWPQYQPDSFLVLQLQRNNITTIVDGLSRPSILSRGEQLTTVALVDFRLNFTNFLNKQELLDEWEK
jgi:hypothetical protein